MSYNIPSEKEENVWVNENLDIHFASWWFLDPNSLSFLDVTENIPGWSDIARWLCARIKEDRSIGWASFEVTSICEGLSHRTTTQVGWGSCTTFHVIVHCQLFFTNVNQCDGVLVTSDFSIGRFQFLYSLYMLIISHIANTNCIRPSTRIW